ncbi:hypothetical protein [Aureivirga marina]|uniref:hypothetical protein n=1 Tax=Aureivirga marina TaxID=1182451 RepID=UPI0018CA83CD|nr:hypothetical protein [Aureivirga marina]
MKNKIAVIITIITLSSCKSNLQLIETDIASNLTSDETQAIIQSQKYKERIMVLHNGELKSYLEYDKLGLKQPKEMRKISGKEEIAKYNVTNCNLLLIIND